MPSNRHRCQTPDCNHDYRYVMVDTETGDTMMLCEVDTMAFWSAVLMRVAEENAG
jgi:hypothetical protein